MKGVCRKLERRGYMEESSQITVATKKFTKMEKAERVSLAKMVRIAKRGDRAALEELCQTIARGILVRISYHLAGSIEAEDVTQGVLIRICESIYTVHRPKSFRAWMDKIVIEETNRYLGRERTNNSIIDLREHLTSYPKETVIYLSEE